VEKIKMAIHGNSNSNPKPHHLYEIRDSVDDEVFKYGISHEEIEDDGLSNRPRLQINFLNLGVKWLRFFAKILIINIPGKKEAKRIERQYIRNHKLLHGEKPRGNIEE
jgi:URI fold toxin 2